jgi:ATP-dependent DNA helicase RecQ
VAEEQETTSPKQRRRKGSPADKPRFADVSDDVAMGAGEERLLAALKTVRTAIAREEHVPAYIVFSDRTLVELAVRRPKSLNALQNVRGVGPMKLERYGARFLAAISEADETEAA